MSDISSGVVHVLAATRQQGEDYARTWFAAPLPHKVHVNARSMTGHWFRPGLDRMVLLRSSLRVDPDLYWAAQLVVYASGAKWSDVAKEVRW